MKTLPLAPILAALFCTAALFPISVNGVEVAESLAVGGKPLALNGAGNRTKFGMTMYVGALYLERRSADAAAILAAPGPAAIRLHMVSSLITSARMEEATREGFEHATGGQIAPIKGEIEAFIQIFRAPIKPGDRFDLAFDPAAGTLISKNGAPAATIAGDAFRRALFGIWLCEKPAQESLKKALLGGGR
ncbi:MAG: chalcone isomerase family protein [Spirochaetes bacterium]|nr:chalcone isomerase family protein [Spirochaetota bacterium]